MFRGYLMFEYLKEWIRTKENEENEIVDRFLLDFELKNLDNYLFKGIIYTFSKNEQLKYWDKDICELIDRKILEIEQNIGKDKFLEVLVDNIELLSTAYEKLLDIEERMGLMKKFTGSEELRAKFFSINIYNDLLNSSYSNILKLFIKFQGEIEGKDLSQRYLTPQIECLRKRNYGKLTELSDSDIRNSISHGAVDVINNKIEFIYRKGEKYERKERYTYDFILDLNEVFDAVSATCLRFFIYLIKHGGSEQQLLSNFNISKIGQEFINKQSLSTILMKCISYYSFNPFGNNEKEQFNIEYIHPDLDTSLRFEFGVSVGIGIGEERNIKNNDSIYIGFKSKKSLTSFITIDASHIINIINELENIDEVLLKIASQSMMWEVNDEIRNDTEDLFRHYEDINSNKYKVAEIEDISGDELKRFKGIMYIEEGSKFYVKKFVEEAIEKLRIIENYGFNNIKVKHGKMEADVIHLSVYKKEIRRNSNKSWLPNNENFICNVQYDINKKFEIRNKLVDNKLKPERVGYLEYKWNPNFK